MMAEMKLLGMIDALDQVRTDGLSGSRQVDGVCFRTAVSVTESRWRDFLCAEAGLRAIPVPLNLPCFAGAAGSSTR
jgi:hypothetical protein